MFYYQNNLPISPSLCTSLVTETKFPVFWDSVTSYLTATTLTNKAIIRFYPASGHSAWKPFGRQDHARF